MKGMYTSSLKKKVAYFTMEIALDPEIHTYSGGLGVLAGDTLRSFADLEVPAVGVTQLNDEGYTRQELSDEGDQIDSKNEWEPEAYLERIPETTTVEIEDKEVKIGAWKKTVESSHHDHSVPILFLDTDLEENEDQFREITKRLYGGDQRYRLFQEIILGIGGCRILDEIGHEIETYHMNESHSSLLALELLKRHDMEEERVKDLCVFTTHTPEGAGHDRFNYDLVEEVLGDYIPVPKLKELSQEDNLHMTKLALNLSGYINAVSKRHEEVTREMFPDYSIDSITNGVHIPRWVSPSFGELYDEYISGWRKDPYKLKHAGRIPGEELWDAHSEEKSKLIEYVEKNTGIDMNDYIFTIGFARRAAPYKRANLIFHDVERLKQIAKDVGEFQVLFAGKAHPQGEMSKEMIKKVNSRIRDLREDIKMAYLENYNIELGAMMTSGVDLWLNTPERGREACGTSGMKASCNGVPQLSTLDGWWIEGHLEGVTGWKIGLDPEEKSEKADEIDAKDLYETLEEKILPKYYADKKKWIEIMKNSISFNASYYNTHRMVREYFLNAYS
ncbi:hypothetical protein AKJ65_03010 [candidate division MSBL1 archaeon SCGC-AAA259E19]|uniref:Alpha-glucan phosphorylase n=1 Tax=candidate division MSBL1 archaeon SCGC-AAA259E19 TaxID=1698264 RepID=A0A133ULC0_9EURY|nr:hypothetical protein AKJ65_03010 [candidate division MSBL1 archaeon SCGC-AAA259E19]